MHRELQTPPLVQPGEGRHTSHDGGGGGGGGGETPKEFLRATFSLPSFTPLCVFCELRALPAALLRRLADRLAD